MSEELSGFQSGKLYRTVVDLGEKSPRCITSEYMGFQVTGGTTWFKLKYKTTDGASRATHVATDKIFAMELIEEDSAYVPEGETNGTTATQQNTGVFGVNAVELTGDLSSVRRGRGRPKKQDASATDQQGVKRRGRPPKNPVVYQATPQQEPAVQMDLNGVPAPRRRGRPPKVAVTPPHMGATPRPVTHVAPVVPPNVPIPSRVEEVDEIEERDEDVVPAKPKIVVAATPPVDDDQEAPYIAVSASEPDAYEQDGDVVPARQRLAPNLMPKRPAGSLARASHLPEEMDGDL